MSTRTFVLPLLAAAVTAALMIAATPFVFASDDVPGPPTHKIQYSPYPEKNFPNRVYFGDTHLHTSYSADAGMIGNTLGPDEAYRFAKGETVTSSSGQKARLARPLDFLVVADHAENLGLAPLLMASDPTLMATQFGKELRAFVDKGDLPGAWNHWSTTKASGKDPLAANQDVYRTAWARLTETAEKHNEPGRFTAFIGFEWTSAYERNNLHRNVIFRGGKKNADTILPFSAFDSVDAEDLWSWMAAFEQKTGDRLLAIPHNGNLSNGLMFDDVTLTSRKPLDRDYAARRARWEPLYETTQMKGDGETHPQLSPNDEFANFERWDKGQLGPAPKTPDMIPREYTREALKRGLAYEAKLGVNPWKFGLIGSSDSHTSLATTTEDNFFGKVSAVEPTADPIRFNEVIGGIGGPPEAAQYHRQASASGLAAVWARENTREALWDAMARKEVYATTGTRLVVRVFGGYDLAATDLQRSDFAEQGYRKGVPMGGDLKTAPAGKTPAFLIRAQRDADGANLDRIQVIKGWLDAAGKTHEKVYDVVWSGSRKPDAKTGKLPAVGNTVNVAEASYTNAIGAPFLECYWKDPSFDPKQRAFYYVRVLEIPTPRWTTFDAKIYGIALPKDVPASIQERAYTSPIWYTPR
ncbi:MAG: DUF3604 domain-containing protein [Gammaproteobacteria bacterium]|nr:DUF3604 domain-containing protein [Gammaproteobacteria bacterium]MDH5226110.1 DUF3604 domain-containing protein [Gammaproteobacteria bacterium]